MADNYDRDDTISPCDECSYRHWNSERCRTCRHRRKKFRFVPYTTPFPYPSPSRTSPWGTWRMQMVSGRQVNDEPPKVTAYYADSDGNSMKDDLVAAKPESLNKNFLDITGNKKRGRIRHSYKIGRRHKRK